MNICGNDKWNPLWSVGAAWRISDQKFYHSNWLQYLKLRMSYGYSGNVDLSKSALAVGSYYSAPQLTGLPFARINNINNPELKWEKIGTLNMGIDFSLQNRVISGTIEYYHKRGKNLYGPAAIDYTTWGFSDHITKNAASMEGNGIDLTINSININRAFKWRTTWLFSYNTSKTTQYYTTLPYDILSQLGSGKAITPVVGKPLYGIAAYKWGG